LWRFCLRESCFQKGDPLSQVVLGFIPMIFPLSRSSARLPCFIQKYPEYECYIAVGSDIDLVADTDGDQVPSDGYNDGRAHITVVTFLHKSVFCPKAFVVNWHKPREKKALEHMAH